MSGPDRLAVYGTLAPGAANAAVLADVPGTWARGTVGGTRYADGWHGYPGVVLGGAGAVEVQVLTSPTLHDHLDRLDAFEGPGYRRVVTTVRLVDGRSVDAWIYELATSPTE